MLFYGNPDNTDIVSSKEPVSSKELDQKEDTEVNLLLVEYIKNLRIVGIFRAE